MANAPMLLPPRLPLLPLPLPVVLFPHLLHAVTLSADELSSILSAVAVNLGTDGKGSRVVGCVPVDKDGGRKGRWGVAARIKDIDRGAPEDGDFVMILEGLARVHLPANLPPILTLHHNHPLITSSYSTPIPSPLSQVSPAELEIVREQAYVALPKELHAGVKGLPLLVLLDVLVILSGVKWEVQVESLALSDRERLAKVKAIYAELSKNPRAIPSGHTPNLSSKVATSPVKTRKAISAPPPEDDLAPIRASLNTRQPELTPEASEAIKRELSRLTNITIQSAEYGVTKTYVEWLLALPWKRVGSVRDGEVGLEEMRNMLESEHEGLQDVKRRVVEYLAVYRLKRQLHVEEQNKRSAVLQEEVLQDASLMDPSAVPLPTSISPEVLHNGTMDIVAPETAKPLSTPEEPVFRDRGPILLLVGPPGVGKTSIARSLATALGRKFHRISLGGVRDEAEIRGHRRTYVGALPGMIVQGLRKVGVANPLFLIDEIDKVGTSSHHGDPSAALLEVLDPEQNSALHDHYLGDVPVDLSQVMFIATANSLETISAPLLDRCEVIECSGYVTSEKVAIAKRFLLPKQLQTNGMTSELVQLSDEALIRIATEYTREAGVRSLERELAKVVRSKAVQYSIARDGEMATYIPEVSLDELERILGGAKYEMEVKETSERPGVVTYVASLHTELALIESGLAYQGSGTGGILLIEASILPAGKGRLVLTGSLGDVIKESAELALSWVKSHAYLLGITQSASQDALKDVDIHLHLPAGAVRKDGPSAGAAIVCCFISLLLNRPVSPSLAMTGELTLRGAITPVGGIKEKVLGAHRAGITQLVLPSRNRKDVLAASLPSEVVSTIAFTYVHTVQDVLSAVWPNLPAPLLESRL